MTDSQAKTVSKSKSPKAVHWLGGIDGHLQLIDQTLLPGALVYLDLKDVAKVWEAIKLLRVRGAPAIGIAAGYGVCVAVAQVAPSASTQQLVAKATEAADYLATSRPTAVNLFWALDRMKRRIAESATHSSNEFRESLLAEARAIDEEDREMCHAIGRFGASLLADQSGVLTHCNTGGLATAEYGTALSAIFTAADQGKSLHVFVDETRPLLQGARLTAWELMQHKIPATLICDSMAAQVMREGRVQAVIIGADRITARGDTANKIGSYGLAVLAKYHNVPFYVAAPSSTFDLELVDGNAIPIEQRVATEITEPFGKRIAPEGMPVYNPAFDVTPAELITALVTEKGIVSPVTEANVRSIVGSR